MSSYPHSKKLSKSSNSYKQRNCGKCGKCVAVGDGSWWHFSCWKQFLTPRGFAFLVALFVPLAAFGQTMRPVPATLPAAYLADDFKSFVDGGNYVLGGPLPTTAPASQPAASQPTSGPSTNPVVAIPVPPPTSQPVIDTIPINFNMIYYGIPSGAPGHPTYVQLQPGVNYVATGPLVNGPSWVTFDGYLADMIVSSPSSLTDVFKITSPGVTFRRFNHIYGAGLLFDIYNGPFEVEMCRAMKPDGSDGIDRFLQTNRNATNAYWTYSFNNHFVPRGIGESIQADNFVSANDTNGATHLVNGVPVVNQYEYGWRVQPYQVVTMPGYQLTGATVYQADGKTIARPTNVSILNPTSLTLPGASKQSLGVRWGDNVVIGAGSATIDGQLMTFEGGAICQFRAGENFPADFVGTPLAGYSGSCGTNLAINGLTLLQSTIGVPPIQLSGGFTTVTINGVQFAAATTADGTVGGSCPFTIKNSTRYLAPGWTALTPPAKGMQLVKPMIPASQAKYGIDGGGNKTVEP